MSNESWIFTFKEKKKFNNVMFDILYNVVVPVVWEDRKIIF